MTLTRLVTNLDGRLGGWTHSSVQYLKMYYVGIDVAPRLEDVCIITCNSTGVRLYIVNYFVIRFAKGEA